MDEVVSALRSGLHWLERRQKRNGRWGASGGLAEVTATTQALRAFTACGFEADYSVARRAVAWLSSPDLSASINHYFWRLGALSEVHPRKVSDDLIRYDLEVVRQKIEEGVSIDSRLNYRAFWLDCALNAHVDHPWTGECAGGLRDLLKADIDVTAAVWAQAALERYDPGASGLLGAKTIVNALQEASGAFHLNGSVAGTAYLVYNCSRSGSLSGDPAVQHVLRGAVRWMISRQESAGNWPTEQPLYGGDPQSEAYYTGIALRALAEYVLRFQPRSMSQIGMPEWRMRRAIFRISRWVALGGLLLAVVGAVVVSGSVGVASTVLGVLSAIAGFTTFYWDARRELRK